MTEIPAVDLTAAQARILQRLLKAGFHLLSIERVSRYLAVERAGFVSLLDPSRGKFEIFGQAGYLIGEGIGMLVERRGKRVFVWKGSSVEATPEMLAAYEGFKTRLKELLAGQA